MPGVEQVGLKMVGIELQRALERALALLDMTKSA
jgi:hypothetical protein